MFPTVAGPELRPIRTSNSERPIERQSGSSAGRRPCTASAARLEEHIAGPNEIVVGEETVRAVRDIYSFESLGEIRLKGLTRGFPAYRLLLDQRGHPLPPGRH